MLYLSSATSRYISGEVSRQAHRDFFIRAFPRLPNTVVLLAVFGSDPSTSRF